MLKACAAFATLVAVVGVGDVVDSVADESKAAALRELRVWMGAGGAQGLDNVAVVDDAFGGQGLVSTGQFGDGVVVLVPEHLAITATVAFKSPCAVGDILRRLLRDNVTVSDDVALFSYLWYHRYHPPAPSFFTPFINTMPSSFDGLPLWMDADELHVLLLGDMNSSPLATHHKVFVNVLAFIVEHFVGPLFPGLTEDDVRSEVAWAIAVVMTRAFGPRFPGDKKALVPLIDFANHGDDGVPLSYTKHSPASNVVDFAFLTRGGIGPGDPLLTSYDEAHHRHCPADMLSSYGMRRDGAKGCVRLSMRFDPDTGAGVPLGALKAFALTQAGIWSSGDPERQFVLREDAASGDDMAALLTFCRLTQMGPADAARFEQALQGMPVSLASERRCLRVLTTALQHIRNGFLEARDTAVATGHLHPDPAAWTPTVATIMHVHTTTLRAIDVSLAALGNAWMDVLMDGKFDGLE